MDPIYLNGEVGPEAASPTPSGTAECRPELLLPHQVELATRAFEAFLESAARPMLEFLCTPVELRFAGVRQGPADKEPDGAEGMRLSLDLSPLPGRAHLALDSGFAATALGLLMGAPVERDAAPRESFTAVEFAIMRPLLELLASELKQAWEPFCPASFQPLAERVMPDPGALVLAAEVELRGVAGILELWVPSLLVRLAAERPMAPAGASRRAMLIEALAPAQLDVEAVLSGASIRIGDLLEIHPGRMLELPYRADSLVDCRVNGIVKFRGELVLNGKSLGVEVESAVEPEPAAEMV